MATQSGPHASAPGNRVAAQLQWYLRAVAAVAAIAALGYAGARLAHQCQRCGDRSCLCRWLPVCDFYPGRCGTGKIKVGDVEVKLQQARERGAEEGRIRGLEAALRSARMSRSVTCQSRGSKQP
jgi:hypothetical protein